MKDCISFLSMRRMDASRRNASALWLRFSQSLASLRQRLSQAMERSTSQRLGSTTKPLGVILRLTISKVSSSRKYRLGSTVSEDRSLLGAVGEQLAQEREPPNRVDSSNATVAVLDVGSGHQRMQHQTQRIDQDVALLALDQLAGIVAMPVDVRPPFSALFTLWLSMIVAVGLASRPASSRHFT